MPAAINIPLETRFGKLIVKALRLPPEVTRRAWLCVCDCGRSTSVAATPLISGMTRSCGCLQKESVSTHGLSYSPEYKTWGSMLQRCLNPKDTNYPNYGGRGITVCSEWARSFEAFYRDMGSRPKGTTLERRDNNGSYCRDNCKWATSVEQNRNRRDNVIYTYEGRTQFAVDWARDAGFSGPSTLSRRLDSGMSFGEALTVPLRSKQKNNRFLTFEGRTQTATRWSKEVGIRSKTLIDRVDRGWTDAQALTMPLHAQILREPCSSTTEVALRSALTVLHVKFRCHEPIYGRPDIFIDPTLCVFVDGDYWHSFPDAVARDIRVSQYLMERQYKVLRFPEHRINHDLEACVSEILKHIQ